MKIARVFSIAFTLVVFTAALAGCEEPRTVQSQTVETETQQIIAGYPEEQSSDTASEKSTDAAAQKAGSADPDKPQPNVEVKNPTHDFGIVGPGTKHKAEFEFTNTGSEPLKIQTIQSTCSCSVPAIEKKIYEPGESGTFSVTYTASEHEGLNTKHLYIISNDPDTPRYQVTLTARIELDVEYGPQRINLSLKKENGGIPPITIKSKDGKEFAITGFSTVRNVITADIDPDKKATEFTLQPKVDLEKLAKGLTGTITITLDHPTTKRLRLYYAAQPMFEVTPARIIFQNAEPGETMTRQLLIKSNYGDNLKVASVESRDNLLKITKRQSLGDRAQMEVAFTAPTDSKGRFFSDVLTIKLESGEELQINASGWLKQ